MGGDPFTAAPRQWPDATVVILASGPSLVSEDVDLCRGRVKVVAVNDAHRLAPWADVLYSSDRDWWSYYKGVPEFAGERWAIGRKKQYAGFHAIRVLKIGPRDGLSDRPDELCTGSNSGYAAVNLAVHFGARQIVLLGFDLGWEGPRSHFFGRHPARLTDVDSHFHYFRKVFAKVPKLLAARGVSIVNCSRRTTMPTVPRRPLADVLSESAVAA